jgi:5-hydroxyisourate hydrolase-like protein (transthyretin family)
MLIAEFVVKTVLKESVKAQRERGLTNRFATDFAQGAAARISEKAYQLWRESNADKIKEQADINDARTKDRLAKKLDMNELKPGQYEFRLLDDDYIQKQDMKLNAENAMQTFKNMAANPPRGIYVVSVKCVEGEMASEHSFSWRIKQTKKKSVARDTVRDWDAYNTGRDAAENIGLRVQVGGSAPTESIQA